jgi:hypothetical protein
MRSVLLMIAKRSGVDAERWRSQSGIVVTS